MSFDDYEERGYRDRRLAEKKFRAFHAANPHIYEALVSLARQAKAAGRRRIGLWLIWGALRWSFFIKTQNEDGFKLSNDHIAFYARYIMKMNPDLAGMFVLRPL